MGPGVRGLLTHLGVAGAGIGLWVLTNPGIALASVGILAAAASVWLSWSGAQDRHRATGEVAEELRSDLAAHVEELRAETARRDLILGAMSEAVILVEQGSIVYANAAAQRSLGAEVGRRPHPQIPLEQAAPAEFELHHPARRQMRSVTVPLAGGALVVVVQDVTEAKRIEAIRRDFVADASHELKTPIAGILATAETLPAAIRDDPQAAQRFAEALLKEAQRLSNMIQDLLDLARLEQGRGRMEPADWSLLVAEAVEDARAGAQGRGVAVEASIQDGVVVGGRGRDLALLARNLLDNAIAYTPANGQIQVRLTSGNGSATLQVRDTGVGIPAKDLPRIFERFYRVDPARARATGGTGLGLSIVRHVAEQHGGSVRAESELGRGSVFTVELPTEG